MKILHILPFLPTPPDFGGALRVYNLLKHLYEHHDLTVAGFSDHGDLVAFEKAFPKLKNKAHFKQRFLKKNFKRSYQLLSLLSKESHWFLITRSASFQKMLDELVDKNQFDLVQFEFPALCQFNIKSDAKTVIDSHNVEYDNFRRMYEKEKSPLRKYFYKKEYEKIKVQEIQSARTRDAVFTTSERDKKIFQNELPEQDFYVIPNGVDTDFFAPTNEKPVSNTLVFTGMMGYVPNSDGINYFIDSILPLIRKQVPDIKLYVVGKNPSPSVLKRASDAITVTGFVEDVRPYIHKAGVYVVPLRMGGGTRLKVLEALSMKKPVVSTSIGCEGIDVKDGEHLLIADQKEHFAESVVKLLKDQKAAQKLSASGKELIENKYKWSAINEAVEQAYSKILMSNNGSASNLNNGFNNQRTNLQNTRKLYDL